MTYRPLMGIVLNGAVICMMLNVFVEPAWADYKIAAGDVIDFSISGVPDLKQKAVVDTDGKVTLPLAGIMSAAGLTIPDLRSKIVAVLSQREFRQRGYNKIERDVISGDEITIAIAEYRPIYVNGDVSKPGSQTFRPGLTARQAVSLAGGFDLLRSRIEDPILQAADLQGSYTKAWINYAKELARSKRLKAELGHPGDSEQAELSTIPLPSSVVSTIMGIENAQLNIDQTDVDRQKVYLTRLHSQLQGSKELMERRRDSESEGLQSDTDEFAKIQDVYKRGLAPNTRMADARRILLLSSIQSLQSSVELERAKTDLEKGARDVDKFDDVKNKKLLDELRDSNASLETLRSDIKVASAKLTYVGMRKSLGRESNTEATVQIVRHTEKILSDMDAALEPGDVVEITLSLGFPKEASQ